MNVILFGKGIFAYVIKVLKDKLILDPTRVLLREVKGRTQRGEGIMKMEAKIGMMYLQAKEHQGLMATSRI